MDEESGMKKSGRQIRFDWIDQILFAVGFVLSIGIAMVLHEAVENGWVMDSYTDWGIFVVILIPLTIRRLIFGSPEPPEPRSGVLWSTVSMVGLLTTIGGAALFGVALMNFTRASEVQPDFETQARVIVDRSRDWTGFRYTIVPPNESPAQRALREERRQQDRLDRKAQRIEAHQARLMEVWVQRVIAAKETALETCAIALLLLALGILCSAMRYSSPSASEPPAT